MSERSLCFIVNPASARCPRDLEERIRRRYPGAEVWTTRGPGQTTPLAVEAVRRRGSEKILLVACGGDGTLREVARAADPLTHLGLIPLGTVNLVARCLGIPREMEEGLDLLERGVPTPVYPGVCRGDGREQEDLFFIGVSVGPDADAVCSVGPRLKRRLGRYAYAWRFLVRMLGSVRPEVTYESPAGAGRCSQLIVLRMPFYGGTYRMSASCSLSEPSLEVIAVDGGRRAVARLFWNAFRNRVVPLPGLGRRRAGEVTVHLPGESGCYQVDGDGFAGRRLEIAVRTEPLHLIIPGDVSTSPK